MSPPQLRSGIRRAARAGASPPEVDPRLTAPVPACRRTGTHLLRQQHSGLPGNSFIQDHGWHAELNDMRRTSIALLVLFSAAGLSACGSSEPKDTSSASAPQLIGPAGGSVALDRVLLEIPRDALEDDVEISAALVQPSLTAVTALSPAYQFSPAGLSFNTPAKLTFTLATADAEARVYRGATLDAPLEEVPGSSVQGSVVSAQINGFSYYVVGKSSRPPQLGITTGVFEHDGNK